jgi:uncharacterized membrane protein
MGADRRPRRDRVAAGRSGGRRGRVRAALAGDRSVGWDVACLYFLISTWSVVGPKTAGDTRAHAVSEDPSAPLADLLICSAAVACIVGAGFAPVAGVVPRRRHQGRTDLSGRIERAAVLGRGAHGVALRYARLFYGASPKGTGIDFNEDDPPTIEPSPIWPRPIGMTFQVSDADLRTKNIRRTALKHALISWLFGAVMVGLTMNILASPLSAGRK